MSSKEKDDGRIPVGGLVVGDIVPLDGHPYEVMGVTISEAAVIRVCDCAHMDKETVLRGRTHKMSKESVDAHLGQKPQHGRRVESSFIRKPSRDGDLADLF